MSIARPAGRPGPPVTPSGLGSEEKARSGSSYQPGSRAGFSIGGGVTLDSNPVSADSPVQKSDSGSLPSTELGERSI